MDQHINLDSLEEIPLSIEDLDLFSEKDPSGACRFNAPIPFGDAPELRFIIQDFLPLGVLGMVVATGGSGKTMLLTQMAYAVASGRDFWGMKTGEQRTVLYIFAEETNAEIHRRLDKIREWNLDESDCDNLHRLCGYGLDLKFKMEGKNNFIEQLEKYISRFRPSLVILDPAAQFNCAENENDSVQSNIFIRMLRKLTEYGSTIIIAHHTSKFGSNQSDQHSSRGSSALTDGARWVLNLTGYDSSKSWENDLNQVDGVNIWQ
ncbi:MAG: AAA family ATPase [SAR324 cluster bacterium]|nr:AAA family ATPase [SAR324 cluster bacterium]